MIRSLSNSLKETLATSTFHSVPNIIRSKYVIIKFMWIICLLVSSAACAYLIYKNLINYLASEVTSTTREIFKNPIMFPKLSICNMNFFANDLVTSSGVIQKILNESLNVENVNFSNKANYLYIRLSAICNFNGLPENVKSNLKMPIDKIILSCIFNNQDCDLNNDFVHYFDQMYGSCFKFNIDQSKYISVSGSLSGLQLELYSPSPSDNKNGLSIYNGFNVFITNQTSFNSYDFEGVLIPSGYSTNIILSKYSIQKQPKPYSNCVSDLVSIDSYPSFVYKKTFEANHNAYSYDNCFNMCFQIYLGRNCNCYDLTSGPFPSQDMRSCLNETDQNCDNFYWTDFLTSRRFTDCDCPYECDKTDYSYSTSLTDYPTRNYVDYLLSKPNFVSQILSITNSNQSLSYEFLSKRMSSVNIFYNQLVETVVHEDPQTTLVYLISNIGGLLSLFLGISFLSFVEIFDILLQSFYIMFKQVRVIKPKDEVNNSTN